MTYIIEVHGHPAPQGSKRHVGNGVMIESSKRVKPWREAVKFAILERQLAPLGKVPLVVNIVFRFLRPKSTKKTALPITRSTGDLDKLERATHDAIVDSGLINDDSQIVEHYGRKIYGEPIGCTIQIAEMR